MPWWGWALIAVVLIGGALVCAYVFHDAPNEFYEGSRSGPSRSSNPWTVERSWRKSDD